MEIIFALAGLVPGGRNKDPKRSDNSSAGNQGGQSAIKEEVETSKEGKDYLQTLKVAQKRVNG